MFQLQALIFIIWGFSQFLNMSGKFPDITFNIEDNSGPLDVGFQTVLKFYNQTHLRYSSLLVMSLDERSMNMRYVLWESKHFSSMISEQVNYFQWTEKIALQERSSLYSVSNVLWIHWEYRWNDWWRRYVCSTDYFQIGSCSNAWIRIWLLFTIKCALGFYDYDCFSVQISLK